MKRNTDTSSKSITLMIQMCKIYRCISWGKSQTIIYVQIKRNFASDLNLFWYFSAPLQAQDDDIII